jgi:dTDP-4-dehydrorhamnose 3,5-epimerase
MQFSALDLDGAWVVDLDAHEDSRGLFARVFCEREFSSHGLNVRWPQCNLTVTKRRGTIRGLHLQADPKPEIKLVRCVAGAVWDVVVDLRRGSRTFGQWKGIELSAQNRTALYVPAGFAHGFQCLTDDCDMFYQMSEFYVPDLARGVRWDDPRLAISWPLKDPIVSERDRMLPTLTEWA